MQHPTAGIDHIRDIAFAFVFGGDDERFGEVADDRGGGVAVEEGDA